MMVMMMIIRMIILDWKDEDIIKRKIKEYVSSKHV